MTKGRRNSEMVDLQSTDFQNRREPNFSWAKMTSVYLQNPGLRGYWTMGSVGYQATDQCRDVSGNGNHLTSNSAPRFGQTALIPFVELDGSAEYLNKTDGGAGNWADIIGTESYIRGASQGLTIIAWVYPLSLPATNSMTVSKWSGTVANRSYGLYHNGTTQHFTIYDAGNNPFSASNAAVLAVDTWSFWAGRFDPSTELKIWNNLTTTTNVAAIPASIFDSTADFVVGGISGGSNLFNGRITNVGLYSAALNDSSIEAIYHQTRTMFGV